MDTFVITYNDGEGAVVNKVSNFGWEDNKLSLVLENGAVREFDMDIIKKVACY